jgi:branched-chain amino acid aminotransferase
MLAIVDGSVVPSEEAFVPATDEGLLRGDGVFDVARLYGGRPFALEDHLVRLEQSARNLRLPLDADALRADVAVLLDAGRPGDGLLRIVVTRGGRRLAFLEPLPSLPAALALRTITYAPTRIMDGIKSLSYGPNMLASRLAREQGADEALLVTPHGRVLEAPTSTFVCSLDGRSLITPPLEDHILDSISRRRLLGVYEVEERPIAADELLGVEEAFLCSTVREVLPVRAIDERDVPVVGPLTAEARTRFLACIEDELRAPAG